MKLEKEQIFAVLQAFDSGSPQSLFRGNYRNEIRCVPLGGDLFEDVLLTKDLVTPGKPADTAWHKETSFLCVNYKRQCLVLELRVLESEKELTYWKILSAYWRQNKRWQPRICFKAHQAPKVTLVREFQTNIVAELHDLSESACALSLWNKDMKHEFVSGENVSAHIKFNEYFTLSTDFNVIDTAFVRRPSCHTRLRLKFNKLSSVEQSQLGILIENMGSKIQAA